MMTENESKKDLLKRDLVHLMNTRGLKNMLEAFIEIFTEGSKMAYQKRLVEDFQRTLDTYEKRHELGE